MTTKRRRRAERFYLQARPISRAKWAHYWPRDERGAFRWVYVRRDSGSWTTVGENDPDCVFRESEILPTVRVFDSEHAPRRLQLRQVSLDDSTFWMLIRKRA